MSSLSLKHIYKVYDGKVKAVNDFSMEIADKEFIVFVGPSGCGKSTTLRMIAGLEEITAGELRIDDVVVNDLEPKDRNIAMVFQNYALYPHMSVYDNMAFSLKIAKLSKDEIHEKVLEAAEILGITEYLDRKPKALSGGQRQRVALGRAIVRNPKVFLLDEPLSNLDAKLRAAMRAEITRLHNKLQTTFIYVTHDQVEAMTMGTRIVVMKLGYVQQIDTPQNLYKYPGNMFVAGFIGTPQMNFFDATILKKGGDVTFTIAGGNEISMDYSLANKILVKYMNGTHPVVVGIRPEDIALYTEAMDEKLWAKERAVVSVVENLGSETLIYANLNTESLDNADSAITIKVAGETEVHRGDLIDIAINKRNIHVFDKETEVSIKTRVPEENVVECAVADGKLTFAGHTFELPSAIAVAGQMDGELILPTKALLLGTGSGRAVIENVENIEGKSLYQLDVNGITMFALRDEDETPLSGEVAFDIDFKSLSVEGESMTVAPLNMTNEVDCKLIKVKELQENGKKGYSFYTEIGAQRILPTMDTCQKLFVTKGIKIFKTPLRYIFDATAVTLAEEGKSAMKGSVEKVLDYGKDRFALVNIEGNSVCTAIADEALEVGQEVNLTIDETRLTIKDTNLDIIIV